MADVEAGQGAGAGVVATWRTPLETTALILLGALGLSIVGGIVSAVFTPGASAWRKLTFLGFNVVSTWHVAVLAIAVGLVLALRIPFPPDARGASTVRAALLGAAVLGAVIALSALIASIGAIGDNEAFVGFSWPEKIGNIMQWLGGGAGRRPGAPPALPGPGRAARPPPPATPPASPPAPKAGALPAAPLPGAPKRRRRGNSHRAHRLASGLLQRRPA